MLPRIEETSAEQIVALATLAQASRPTVAAKTASWPPRIRRRIVAGAAGLRGRGLEPGYADGGDIGRARAGTPECSAAKVFLLRTHRTKLFSHTMFDENT